MAASLEGPDSNRSWRKIRRSGHSETPCRRARSAVFAPASASFNIPMICSSVNLVRFIVRPLQGPDSNQSWRKIRGSGHLALMTWSPFLDRPAGRHPVLSGPHSSKGDRFGSMFRGSKPRWLALRPLEEHRPLRSCLRRPKNEIQLSGPFLSGSAPTMSR